MCANHNETGTSELPLEDDLETPSFRGIILLTKICTSQQLPGIFETSVSLSLHWGFDADMEKKSSHNLQLVGSKHFNMEKVDSVK